MLQGEGPEESPLNAVDLGAPGKFTAGQHFLEVLVKVESEGQQRVRPRGAKQMKGKPRPVP